MAFEIPIGESSVLAIVKGFGMAADEADRLATSVDRLNGLMGRTQTLGGRTVQAPANPADPSPMPSTGLSSSRIGPADPTNPYRGGGARQTLAREMRGLQVAQDIGDEDLTRDQQARAERARRRVEVDDRLLDQPRDTRGGRSMSLDPYSGAPGTRARLEQAQAMLSRARQGDDQTLIKDWEEKVNKSQAAVDKLDGGRSGFGGAIKNALMRSRVNLGPLSPLVMDMVGGLGEGAAVGLGAVGVGASVLRAGYEQAQRNSAAFYSMGGSNSAGALALGGDNAEAKALQLGDRLREGTVGSGYLRSQGIQYRGRYTDVSGNYTAAIDAIARIQDPQERVRVARETGLTDDVWLGDVSAAERRRLMDSRGLGGTPQEQEQRRKATAQTRSQMERAKNYLGQGAELAFDWTVGLAMTTIDAVGSLFGGRSTPSASPTKTGPQGWDRNVFRPMSTGPETINGTTMGAIPAGWRGKLLSDVLDNQGIMVGGFTI